MNGYLKGEGKKTKPIDYIVAHEQTTAEFIAQMQTLFPKYCKASNSMCNRGEEYGVSLSPKAVRWLNGGKPAENRTKSRRFNFRLLDADGDAFTRARLKNGHTVQEAAEKAIMLYIAATYNKKEENDG